MRLTQFSDYAWRLLMHVADQDGQRTTIADAAKANDISRSHLMKVAQRLAQPGGGGRGNRRAFHRRQIVEAPHGQGPVELPALLLWGSRSNYVQAEGLATMREHFPALEDDSLEAGHWLHAERASEFQQAVVAFLDRVARA